MLSITRRVFSEQPKIKSFCKGMVSKKKLLLIVVEVENCINTISESIYEIARLSKYDIYVLNLYNYGAKIPRKININDFDGIILHNTATYDPQVLEKIDFFSSKKLSAYKGIKIIFKQDEAYRTNQLISYINKTGFDVLFTCWDMNSANVVYQKLLPKLRIESFLTGYVSDRLKSLKTKCNYNRQIDVGYRGSLQPITFGRLSYEKHEIGDKFLKVAYKYGLIVDISSRWEDRIVGTSWFDFLNNCKCTLGVESGMSIVDLDGQVEKDYRRFLSKNKQATDEQILEHCLEKYEHGIQYRAIAPRHLEAIACYTTQILYEGSYQGILKPDKHYIELKKDWSNIEEVVYKIKDFNIRNRINECAYEEILLNYKYSYQGFVERMDEVIDDLFKK